MQGYKKDTYATIADAKSRGWNLEDLLPHLKTSAIPSAIWMPVIAQAYRIPKWAVTGWSGPSQPAGIRNMTIQRLHSIAAFLGLDFTHPPRPAGFSKQELIAWISQNYPQAVSP